MIGRAVNVLPERSTGVYIVDRYGSINHQSSFERKIRNALLLTGGIIAGLYFGGCDANGEQAYISLSEQKQVYSSQRGDFACTDREELTSQEMRGSQGISSLWPPDF